MNNNEVSTYTLKTLDTVRPTKIRKIETDVEDDEDEDEEVADNSTGIVNFFTNRATEVFLDRAISDQQEVKKVYNALWKKQLKIINSKSKKNDRNTTTFSRDVQE